MRQRQIEKEEFDQFIEHQAKSSQIKEQVR